ncbi:pre-mRNA-splicing factor SYF1-like [Tetranychus urticae]|uniref:BUB1 N-terminal domain-containing protein n=1 Tax=Tetranychus urticae TaxID=32264 RepID=T1KW46_TETUR|nr:pre-mRNA-splicing factor SYF1-like [Tetranychus urticae]
MNFESSLLSKLDLNSETEIVRHPYSTKHWLRYINAKKDEKAPVEVVNLLYERALKEIPGSYKLWYGYLLWRKRNLGGKIINGPEYKQLNNCFERSLVFMHKMPRIWILYIDSLMHQHLITQSRRTFDRALQALPITQHNRIWPLYLKFVKSHRIPETAIRLYKRYLKLAPEDGEEFIDYLRGIGRLDDAALKLYDIVNDDNFISKEGKSKHQLWNDLCELISKNPDKVQSLNVENIIREGIKQYRDEQGKLWNAYAQYFTRSGLFERARDIYEEAISSVMTIKDFSLVFDAYCQSEENLLKAQMEAQDSTDDEEIVLELQLAKYEYLIERRPLLLNSVALKQNPHNVDEWHKRVKLLEENPLKVVRTYMNAVQTVDPKQAIGKVHSLWIEFAKFYEKNGQLEDAREVFEQAVKASYARVNDLATVWCEYAEMELRSDNFEQALKLMQRATTASKKANFFDENEPVQNRVHRSLKLWLMYADLEESFGTFKTTKATYDAMIDLRIITPQIIMNYGVFLEENNYYEEAFKAYEKGIDLFKWPIVYDLWNTYLTKFLHRYKGEKIERTRDLFEQCLRGCPPSLCKNFYLLFARFELDYGLAKNSMTILERATQAVDADSRFDLYNIYIKKAAEMFDLTYTRQIYERAIENLRDNEAREMCLRFADLEQKLGEIDRARAIYAHCSQISDPRTQPEFWDIWKLFETKHGNEDTLREMLRIKRSFQASANTSVNFVAAQMSNVPATISYPVIDNSQFQNSNFNKDEIDIETDITDVDMK